MPYEITTFTLPGGGQCVRVVGSGYITREDADYLMAHTGQGNPLHGLPVLVLTEKMEGVSSEARNLFAGGPEEQGSSTFAVVVTSPIIRVTTNFVLRISRHKINLRMFAGEAEAVQWLDEQALEHAAKPRKP